MARATGHGHGPGAPHRYAPYPASNAANAGGREQTTRQPAAATTNHQREIPDSQEDPADALFSDEVSSNEEADEDSGNVTEDDPDPEETRRRVLQWFKDHEGGALAPTQVEAPVAHVEAPVAPPEAPKRYVSSDHHTFLTSTCKGRTCHAVPYCWYS